MAIDQPRQDGDSAQVQRPYIARRMQAEVWAGVSIVQNQPVPRSVVLLMVFSIRFLIE
jgi:hypothetical protein